MSRPRRPGSSASTASAVDDEPGEIDDIVIAENLQGGGVIARHTAVVLGPEQVAGWATNQKRGLSELKADLRKDLGALAPLIRLLRPAVTWFLVRSSPYLEENRCAPPT